MKATLLAWACLFFSLFTVGWLMFITNVQRIMSPFAAVGWALYGAVVLALLAIYTYEVVTYLVRRWRAWQP